MNEIQAWTYLVTLAIPFVAAVVNRPSWSASVKRWVMIGVSVVISVVVLLLQGEFSDLGFNNVFAHIVSVVGLTQIWYSALAAVPIAKRALDKLEVSTSRTSPTEAIAQTRAVKDDAVAEFQRNVGA